MKQTPLTHLHRQVGARMTHYAGFEMPVEYSGVIDEHNTVRNAAGLFDVSHMGEFWVKGEHALEFLEYVTTNHVASLREGQAQYSCLPNGKGGIVDDLIIYRYSSLKYMLVVNAANIEKDWKWLNQQNRFGAELEDASENTALIALQGPKSGAVMEQLLKQDMPALAPFTFLPLYIKGVGEIIVSATGYTGSGGYELFCFREGAEKLWNDLSEAGKPFGLKAAGLAARDTLRLEMGYALYGNDIDDTTSALEAGLGWIVKLQAKGDFIDREFMLGQKTKGLKRRLVGLEMIDRGIPRKDYPVVDPDGNLIGRITSGTMSPSLGRPVGMAYVQSGWAEPGSEVRVQIRNKNLKAKVVKLPFLKK